MKEMLSFIRCSDRMFLELVKLWDQIQQSKGLFKQMNLMAAWEQIHSLIPLFPQKLSSLSFFFYTKPISCLIVDGFGLTFYPFAISSHSFAEEAEATVQGECGGQEAQAAESPERGT